MQVKFQKTSGPNGWNKGQGIEGICSWRLLT